MFSLHIAQQCKINNPLKFFILFLPLWISRTPHVLDFNNIFPTLLRTYCKEFHTMTQCISFLMKYNLSKNIYFLNRKYTSVPCSLFFINFVPICNVLSLNFFTTHQKCLRTCFKVIMIQLQEYRGVTETFSLTETEN